MTGQLKFLIITGVITIAIIVGAAFWFGSTQPAGTNGEPVDTAVLVTEDAYTSGNPDAKVTLVEFADFQCPACGAAAGNVSEVIEKFGDDLHYVFRHYPLSFHKNSELAALAAEAAGAQDKFKEMHDLIFAGQKDWGEADNALEIFQGYADKLELDREKFDKSIDEEEFIDKIKQGTADGNSAGVSGTPTFYINGVKHEGGFDAESLSAAIQEELDK